MKIYTRTGDTGTTSLVDGSRISKTALRVEVYGTIDEINSWVGAARAFSADPLLERCLEFLQHRFYNCSSNVATPPGQTITPPGIDPADVTWLEQAIDHFEEKTGKLDRFVVPGGSKPASLLHIARTVCRRGERLLVHLAEQEPVDQQVRNFINRSSDFLFAAARYANSAESLTDVFWQQQIPPPILKPQT